ncbi:NADP-dependent malic enzyme [Candidatus Haliotispira prima]|uniref:NADP-dependent malic enzyme n=1 Tax=Candidatus Haliotispira prima TaxID=3034016 RepID=A0ABY8MKB9_9SPIO|nr:NADP-dependent malic enzyme [Candidatus Haliotispira prima]
MYQNNTSQDDKETLKRRALNLHESYGGKIATEIKIPIHGLADLALAYSPGVAEPCRKIAENPADIFRYTNKTNTVAVISDGSAVLGLGNIGPRAGLPVMEGKALLFKHFAGLDAVPLCLDVRSPEQLVEICCALEPNYGAINLEDIASPNCVTVTRELQERLSIPVFHDDQDGTAVVCAAALRNAALLTGRKPEDMRVVLCGMGAAGSAIARTLKQIGVGQIAGLDKSGVLRRDTGEEKTEWAKHNFVLRELFAEDILHSPKAGQDLADLLRGADAFIGVSTGGLLRADMVRSMAKDPIVFAMANPDPEISPEEALAAGAKIVGTGRMDYPNRINNVLAFPGIFRGAMLAQQERAPKGLPTRITTEMKLAAIEALAEVLSPDERRPDAILPSPMDPRVVRQISAAVCEACRQQ